MPRTITIRLDEQGEARLARLLRLTRMGQQAMTDVAYAHLLATLEQGLPVYVLPPSEVKPDSE